MIEESQIQPANDAECDYDSSRFKKLSDRDHVRMRYGMYIGDNGVAGLHHLAEELINNAIDEALAGHASQLFVTIHSDGRLSVEDDGRGIPIDRHPGLSEVRGREVSALEATLTHHVLSVGNRQKRRFGIGLQVVNYLSKQCIATIWRGGAEYHLRFESGELVGELARMGATNKHGTRFTIQPDPEIFETAEFQFERLQTRLRELAYLHPGVRIHFRDERTKEFCFQNGISEFVEELSGGRLSVQPEPFRLAGESKGIQFEVAFHFTASTSELIRTYVNDIHLPDGGTPVVGLQRAITRVLMEFCQQQGLVLERSYKASRCGLTAVIALRLDEPMFVGATRNKVRNPEMEPMMKSAVYEYLQKRFAADPQGVREFLQIGMNAAKARVELNL